MGVDYQIRRILLLETLKALESATGIDEGGHFVADEDGVGEGKLAALFPLHQKDVGGDVD
jgi:hypothetical protein